MSYLDWFPFKTNTAPRAFDEKRFKKGLKSSLVVVVELNAVGRV